MRQTGFALCMVMAFFAGNSVFAVGEPSKPNILFIMVDDLGKDWIGCYGDDGIKTPHIDRLAAGGMKFTNAYSMPQYTPTRVTLLTGQYPWRTGWVNHPDAFFSGTALTGYYTQGHEETNVHRPLFTENYFDITNAFHVMPDFYYCQYMLLSTGVPRCGGQNVKVRLSFRKVDPNDDYQSLYYPDNVELKDDSGNAIVMDFNGRRCDGSDGTGTVPCACKQGKRGHCYRLCRVRDQVRHASLRKKSPLI